MIRIAPEPIRTEILPFVLFDAHLPILVLLPRGKIVVSVPATSPVDSDGRFGVAEQTDVDGDGQQVPSAVGWRFLCWGWTSATL